MNNKSRILNSRIKTTVEHNNIDEQVKRLVDEDIKNNIIQQSLLDAVRQFNIRVEAVLQCNSK